MWNWINAPLSSHCLGQDRVMEPKVAQKKKIQGENKRKWSRQPAVVRIDTIGWSDRWIWLSRAKYVDARSLSRHLRFFFSWFWVSAYFTFPLHSETYFPKNSRWVPASSHLFSFLPSVYFWLVASLILISCFCFCSLGNMHWIGRKIFLYNVTFGLYMLDWWESYLFSILCYPWIVTSVCFLLNFPNIKLDSL